MNTAQKEEGTIQIDVVRVNEKEIKIEGVEGLVKTTTEVFVNVVLWTTKSDTELVEHKLSNLGSVIQLELQMVSREESQKLPNPLPVSFSNRYINLEFNDFDKYVFSVIILDPNSRPTGKRRKVVIYEDTDIIDSGINPNPPLQQYE